MFDLEPAIVAWRQSLATREALSTDNIAELESHLRELVASLHSTDLSDGEAFLIAQRRVGHPSDLDAEFAKEPAITRWVQRSKWMCIGILGLMFVRSTSALLFGIARLIGLASQADPMMMGIVYNMAAIFCSWLLVVVSLFVVLRHDALMDRIAQRFSRIPKPILIGLPVAVIMSLSALMLFNIYMTSGQGQGLTAFRLSFLAYDLSTPTLFLVAGFVLHRFEQRRILA